MISKLSLLQKYNFQKIFQHWLISNPNWYFSPRIAWRVRLTRLFCMSEILEQWHFSNKCLSTKIFFESLYPVTFSQISKTFLSQKLFSVVDAFQTLPKGWCSTYSVVSETSYGKYTSKRIFCLHVVVKMSPKLIYLTIFIWAVVFLEESFAKGGVGKNSARRKILVCIMRL